MGIYIFQSKHSDAIKIGHYSGKNAWSRVAHRGFNSCQCPKDLTGRVNVDDLTLTHWFPRLGRRDERHIHNDLKQFQITGEWYTLHALPHLKDFIKEENQMTDCDYEAATGTRRRL